MNKEAARNTFALIYKYFKVEVSGQENLETVRRGENAIIAFFPHTGHLDGPFARLAIPSDLRDKLIFPAAADYWYKNDILSPIRNLATSLIVPNFPLNRKGSSHIDIVESLDEAVNYLNSGFSLAIAPEGTRTSLPLRDRELKTGVAELVIRTGKPVIPMLFTGLQDVMPKGTSVFRILRGGSGRKISATIGEPIYFDVDPGMKKSAQRREILTKLKDAFLSM
jgi:1-acyl-sn-glycerol-3-phosphate acyltransferase